VPPADDVGAGVMVLPAETAAATERGSSALFGSPLRAGTFSGSPGPAAAGFSPGVSDPYSPLAEQPAHVKAEPEEEEFEERVPEEEEPKEQGGESMTPTASALTPRSSRDTRSSPIMVKNGFVRRGPTVAAERCRGMQVGDLTAQRKGTEIQMLKDRVARMKKKHEHDQDILKVLNTTKFNMALMDRAQRGAFLQRYFDTGGELTSMMTQEISVEQSKEKIVEEEWIMDSVFLKGIHVPEGRTLGQEIERLIQGGGVEVRDKEGSNKTVKEYRYTRTISREKKKVKNVTKKTVEAEDGEDYDVHSTLSPAYLLKGKSKS
jgi:hypothetical protein